VTALHTADILLDVKARGLRFIARAMTEQKYRRTLASLADTGILPTDQFPALDAMIAREFLDAQWRAIP
jgi:hypothetical protein